ncbi:MAG: enterobactin transporter EntS [Gordonia sp.]|nr:enterobactin transporter EntS [Gordonia sp. (in: high G+C Gram-positive bacteria)]
MARLTCVPDRSILIDLSPLRESAPFRRIFIARLISLVGIGMLMVSVPIQMYELTKSSAHVGGATATTGISTFIGMLIGGILADKYDRRIMIIIGRTGAMLAFGGLAANAFGVFGGEPRFVAVYAFAAADGLIGALSIAALMASLPTLLPKEKMVAVGALNSISVRVGTAISPGVAGLIIYAAGVGWTYTAATVLSAITVLLLFGLPSMPPTAHPAAPPHGPGPDDSDAEHDPSTQSIGVFLRTQRVVGSVMAVGVVAMLGAGVVALIPALADERFSGDERAIGFAYAALAVGALLAAITSGWLPGVRRPGVLLMSALMFAFCLHMLFGLTSLLWLALLILVVGGYGDTIQEILRFSLIQHHTPGPILGRVTGLWTAQEVGGITVGSLVAGMYGTIWPASDAIVYYGLTMLVLAAAAMALLGSLRRVDSLRASAPSEPTAA